MAPRKLKITNARENNLKEVNLEIAHDRLVVLTGLSGSGKSSLAFDTVYAEGQRRYIETFSPYTRQFFDKVKKPDVDLIENVRPAVAIQQRTRITNSRSTVGSMTNVNDYLKILWSNLAVAVCPTCGTELRAWTAGDLSAHLAKVLPEHGHASALICAPLPIKRDKKSLLNELDRLKTLGYSRYLNPDSGAVESLEDATSPALHSGALMVVLDRVKIASINLKRLRESIEQAFVLSDVEANGARGGTCVVVELANDASSQHTSSEFYNVPRCPSCHYQLQKAKPALFSFNHPIGACPECKGFGKILQVDPAVCVPNPSLSIKEKALQCWAGPSAQGLYRRLIKFCADEDIPTNVPWRELTSEQQEKIFDEKSRAYCGVRPWFKRLERKSYKMHVRVFLAKYRGQYDCPECKGTRLRPAALAYRVEGKTLPDIWDLTIGELLNWSIALQTKTQERLGAAKHIDDVFVAVISRLQYLNDLGLSYLTLNRQARTLSGGETQRVNLATALGSELISTHFVLDEPSVGLHARDSQKLIESVRKLQQRGNSLLVVEHDLDFMREADDIIELGPQAGAHGGEIVFNGPVESWPGIRLSAPVLADVAAPGKKDACLHIRNASARNLKNIDVTIPLHKFVCLSGVSGSGKSTLVNEVIEKGYRRYVQKSPEKISENAVSGFDAVEQVLIVDQSPLAKSPRANIATYSRIWDAVRDLLAETDDARLRALSKSAFSFNVDGGRCPACKGAGFVTEDMQFLSDVYIPCEMCLGKRFQAAVLEVRTHGYNVHELLQMSIEKCAEVFKGDERTASAASTLTQLGLGHLTLGHPLSELSGGEAQRLKLVPFIEQASSGKSLLIFDEPTTGLHYHDVERLIDLLRLLVARGHSVLCIEHNLSLLAACDWIIDLGPEAGDAGGHLVLSGSPRDFLKDSAQSIGHTAPFLRRYIDSLSKPSKPKKAASAAATARLAQSRQNISIRGAREHNLKNISVEVPLDQVVVFTGVSGSGKSSIAKDIIYAEGQRRYLDCLSPYARQYIKELKRPEIDEIKNVQPTICVYQHTFQPGRLSTVGTMSEIYNFLRLLYAKTGTQFCPDHPTEAISPLSAKEIAAQIKRLNLPGVRILAPVIKMKKGNHRAVIERARTSEISELRIDGMFLRIGSLSGVDGGLEKSKVHSIDFTLAKLNPTNVDAALLEEVVAQALSLGGGTLVVHSSQGETVYSLDRTCPQCKRGFFKPDPEDFSFHSRRGQCPHCSGTGKDDDGSPCPECKGARIHEIGRNVRLDGLNIHEASKLAAPALYQFLHSLALDERNRRIAEPILHEVQAKIQTLVSIGLEYVELARDCETLSGGELQRLRLATAIGSPLAGVTYIFDEPSVGLHPIENLRVLEQLRTLKDRGNSVIIIEHDADSILSGDYIIEVGPGGGSHGGEIVFSGKKNDFKRSTTSVTAAAIREAQGLSQAARSKKFRMSETLKITGATRNNIHNLDLKLPLLCVTTVAGVSGAGKSSLVHGIISDGITHGKGEKTRWKYAGSSIESSTPIERIITVDQKPIGLNSRSTPASYLGIWDDVRNLFAQTIEAKARGWQPSFFSYNTGKGRCPECKGQGQVKLEMSFLADAAVQCESCNGTRYGDEALSVRYMDFNIAEALNFTFEEAKARFANHRKIYQPLVQACELGLGYLTLGQSSSTLSGGESQRIKLVSELSSPRQGHTVYILDEPTTGLHKADVARLVKVLKDLVAKGNSVFLIEHDADVLLQSDYIVEMGPGPGEKGGRVIFTGSPEELLAAHTPWAEVLRKGAAEVLEEQRTDGPKTLSQQAAPR
ncbi:MAG: excinuclease ABC subunit UvrA [Deltaproteobacteria bacterium]|nr:excinuclease ABC subunit UvrA [Deltaproteobacteria bacterium]